MKLEKRGNAAPAAPNKEEPPKKTRSVLNYILILFIAAFLLMALSFFMHQRSNTETMGALQSSVSTMQELQAAQERIIELQDQLAATEELLEVAEESLEEARNADITELQNALAKASAQADKNSKALEGTARAMDLFWQIDEAYVLGRTERCRDLIEILETEVLAPYLPAESTTDNGRFSPYDRYAEICEALGEVYGAGVKIVSLNQFR